MDNKDTDNFLKEIDEEIERAVLEERNITIEKEAIRKKKRKRRKIIAVILVFAVFAAVAAIVIAQIIPNYYHNNEEFQSFANEQLSTYEICPHPSEEEDEADDSTFVETRYTYDKNQSIAIREYYKSFVEASSETEDNTDEETNDDSKKNNADLDESSEELEEADFESTHEKIIELCEIRVDNIVNEYKDSYTDDSKPSALIIDVSITESSNGACSLAIVQHHFHEVDKEMVRQSSDVDTFLYEGENNNSIDAVQALHENYKKIASDYVSKYVEEFYREDELTDGWEDYVAESDKNYNSFIIVDSTIIFIFDEGTIMPKESGIVNLPLIESVSNNCLRPKLLKRYIDPDKPMVALTYDDGPGGDSEAAILKVLEENNSVATFFYLGNRVANFKDNAVKAVEIGCEVGNHSWSHPLLTSLSKKDAKKQITKTTNTLKEYCNYTPSLMRPPYGDYNDKIIKAANMPVILWSIDTLDWKTRNAKKIVKSVKKKKDLDGQIILMHSIYDETAEATEILVPWLKKKGYQLVTVSELIKYKTGEKAKAGTVYTKVK